jgi:rSAM/selenodomain-associated transferase 2
MPQRGSETRGLGSAHVFSLLVADKEEIAKNAPGTESTISIVIPTFNEAESITHLLSYLRQATAGEPAPEILVVDGGSLDATVPLARQAGATVLLAPRKGRAAQLNYGAQHARGELLYFLHADSYPPAGFLAHLRGASALGYEAGCYRLAFDHPHWLLRFSAWCTRLPLTAVRFGDQSLFVRRDLFARIGGYRENLLVMEDQEIVRRLRARGPFRVLPHAVTTSARKYLANGIFRLQGIFTLIVGLYWLGVPQRRLVQLYRWLIQQGKL